MIANVFHPFPSKPVCLLVASLLFFEASVFAQIRVRDPKTTAERSVEGRVNGRIDQGIDKGLDKVEEGIGSLFKKKDKNKKQEKEEPQSNPAEVSDTGGTSKNSPKSNAQESKSEQPKSLKVYSKFDFVPGEKVIAFDDFSTTNVGDFPLGWNTNSSAEVVTLDDSPTKWLFMTKDGFFQPTYVKDLPENFTLEFDVFTRYNSNNLLAYSFYLTAADNPKKEMAEKYIKNGIYFEWRPCGGGNYIVYENSEEVNKNDALNIKQFDCGDDYANPSMVKMSLWRQKNRLRVYANETKVLDIPQAFDPKLKYNSFKFGSAYMNYATADNKDEFMVSNIRYAVGAPDTRSKLITEGKFSTTGILFNVNSDKIKPESYGVLKEVGSVLKENATVKVRIIGHTDSDGEDAANLDLSKRRAASVKSALQTEFGIDPNRMETDGKGETQAVAPNTTPEGKANNRRVEFIKL